MPNLLLVKSAIYLVYPVWKWDKYFKTQTDQTLNGYKKRQKK